MTIAEKIITTLLFSLVATNAVVWWRVGKILRGANHARAVETHREASSEVDL